MSWPTPPYEPNAELPQYGYGHSAPGQPVLPYGFVGAPPGYGWPRPRNGLAVTSLVLGILAIATCWLTIPGVILGVLAVIFGGVGLARSRNDRVSNKGMAIAGLVTGAVGMVIGAVLLVLAIQVSSACMDQYGPVVTDQELTQCVQDHIN